MTIKAKPTIEEAVRAADVIQKSNKLYGFIAGLGFFACIALAFYEPLALLALVILLPTVVILNREGCKPSEALLHQFARERNWFFAPRDELRHVEGQTRRKRFYLAPVLIPIEMIIQRIRRGDFSPDPTPPSGEVPRQRPSRNTPQPKGSSLISRQLLQTPSIDQTDEWKEKNLVQELEQRALEDRQRIDEEERQLEEERRHANEELQRLEEERIAEQLAARLNAQKLRAEEARHRLEDPRFKLFLKGAWTDFLSVRNVWLLIERGEATLSDHAVEKGDGRIQFLEQFPDLAALFDELVIPNTHDTRTQRRRDPREKSECIKFHGTICAICGFSFADAYGDIGEGYIEVHHLKPISEDGDLIARIINPIADLRPVCANCHRMLHTKSPPYSIEEMIVIRAARNGDQYQAISV
jgi:hypothetical protein